MTDPAAVPNARRSRPELHFADTALEACDDAEAVLLLTEWSEYTGLDPRDLGAVVASPVVIDARHALDAPVWVEAGWTHRAPGSPVSQLEASDWSERLAS